MKNTYEKLEYELLKYFTLQNLGGKLNRLIKFQLELKDDDVVYTGIENIMQHLKEAHRLKQIQMYMGSRQETQVATELMRRLATYCRSQVESQEPEWMTLARQHGWTPPK